MTAEQQLMFASFAQYLNERMDYIPLTFLLGFFVTIVVDRWKNIFANIGFVDTAAFYVTNYITGDDEETKIARRNIVRYLCLTQVMVLRDISIKVRKRFPNMDSVVEAGFLQIHEKALMDKYDNEFSKYWVPINWIFAICVKLRRENKIAADVLLNGLLTEVRTFHSNLRNLCNYDWVPVPLAYPQVVFLAVRVYFIICLISRQYIVSEGSSNYSKIDLFIPFMSMLQLIFYMGWLKVAEALLNPLGEDDDDFESNYIIDRNITIALTMVEQTYADVPFQKRDAFHTGDKPLYSEETANMPVHALIGSAARLVVDEPKEKIRMVPRNSVDITAEKINEKERPESFNIKSSHSLSSKIRGKIGRNRSQSLSLQTLEGGRNRSPDTEAPKAWYDNKEFSDFSASTPTRPLDTVNEESFENDTQNEYCPLAWAVKRKTDGSVLTCEPHNPNKKCPKPYMCIASKCGINFCCANEKMLEHVRNMEEAEAENKEDDEL
uniref:Bestrophin homolog n=1 Tax=Panagrolaimus sp. JU765 TaxID=591449 RepID=A0AC34QT14_9BILA